MKKVIHILMISMIMAGLVLVFAGPSTAKPIKFKAVAFLPVSLIDVEGFNIFTRMKSALYSR